jgi:hypothetical protein
VRFDDETEDGLFDARPNAEYWASETEIKRWKELKATHPEKSDTEISELVLSEDIPKQLRKDLIDKVNDNNF